MDDTITVEIGPRSVTLALPAVEDCWAIADAWNDNRRFAMGAALGLCWQTPRPPKLRLADFRYNVLEYGRAVWADRREDGWPHVELMAAAAQALTLALESVVSNKEVADEAERFRADG